jgi:cholesterol transport system auxiliary component
MNQITRPLAAGVLFALAGCGNILPQPAPPPLLYRLTPASQFSAPGRAVPVQLVVDAPTAEAALDTTRIALTRSPTTLDYFADAAWTDRLSAMLQTLLIASLDNAHRIAAVGPQSGQLRAEAALVTTLSHFEAVYRGDAAPEWRIDITAKLVKMPERTLIATRSFSAEAKADRNGLSAIVDAADAAWHHAAGEIADWTATALAQAGR